MPETAKSLSYSELLQTVPTKTESIRRCYLLAGKSIEEAAWEVSIDLRHFRRMMNANDSRHFPPDLIVAMMKAMGNQFPLDWEAYQMGQVCYPLEFMWILEGIKDALRAEGRPVNFALGPDDRVAALLASIDRKLISNG